jgi:hypothetical protein
MYAKLGALFLAIVVAACATSSGRSSTERAVVFSGNTLPTCDFEVVQVITVMVSVRGDRKAAEEALHRELDRRAERRGADGVIRISIQEPRLMPVVTSRGRPRTEADLPPAEWNATAQAIRFLDPECRS